MSKKISASLMCGDLLNLESEIRSLEKSGVDYLHLDFMDGVFVSNTAFSAPLIRACRKAAGNMGTDIHIMGTPPEKYFDSLEITNGDIVSFHYEACESPSELIRLIRSRGGKALLALSPDTPAEVLSDYVDEIDGALIMTVYPGDSGRPLVPSSFEKIKAVRDIFDKSGKKELILEVDGCVSWENAPKMSKAGADMFVTGTSSVFENRRDYEHTVLRFREIVN